MCSYRVKRRKRLASLGRADVLILDQVRKKATAYLGKVASNEDPQDESDALRVSRTVADVVHAYVENHAKPKKNKTSIKKTLFNRCAQVIPPRLEIRRSPE